MILPGLAQQVGILGERHIHTLPVATRTKRPPVDALPLEADAQTGELKPSWRPLRVHCANEASGIGWEAAGVEALGWICGAPSAIEAVDADLKGPRLRLGQVFLDRIKGRAPELFGRLLIWRSISGGLHIPYRCTDLVLPGSFIIAAEYRPHETDPGKVKKKAIIETRGEGGYIIFWPGVGCEVLQGDPFDPPLITASERDALHVIAAEFTEGIEHLEAAMAYQERQRRKQEARRGTWTAAAGQRPGDAYNAQATVGDVMALLERDGATCTPLANGRVIVTRPGKDARAGSSGDIATIRGGIVFFQFSTSWPTFEADRPYDPFGVFTAVEHGGDHAAAAKHLAAMGYGAGWRQEQEARAEQHDGEDARGATTAPEAEAGTGGEAGEVTYPPVRAKEVLKTQAEKTILTALGGEEAGDAQLFATLYRDRVRYDHSDKMWYLWAGHVWREDRRGLVRLLITGQLSSQYLALAATLNSRAAGDPDKQKVVDALQARARNLRRLKRIQAVLQLAQSYLPITGEQWDSDPFLLPCVSGVIDLRTGEHRAGQPTEYLRRSAPVAWSGLDAAAPRWEQFLREVFAGLDRDALIEFLHRLFGCAMTGQATEHVFPIFWGPRGRNGKDTLLTAIERVLGPLAGPVSRDVILAGKRASDAPTPSLCSLQGMRLAWASETGQETRLNAAQVKQVTGGGSVRARKLYGNEFTFRPSHMLCLLTNYKPTAPADDAALFERIKLVPFTNRFLDDPDPQAANECKRDPRLGEKLAAEGAGILAWLVRGALAWQRDGLQTPDCVRLATTDYQQEEDLLGQFIEACCYVGDGAQVRGAALYAAYAAWAKSMNLEPLTGTAFGKRMGDRFSKKKEGTIIYQGIGLRAPDTEAHGPGMDG
jgi:putative DNA primase/helicase